MSEPSGLSAPPLPLRRYIHHLRVELPAATEGVAEARSRLGEKFPRPALRRMTHLGLLVGAVLDGTALTGDDAIVYASTFAETRALESYLASFPSASPALFQTSIHPGAVQQVLIGRQQPVTRLWPLASRYRLVEQALVAALLEPAERVVFVGGEERGTWMLEHGMASDRPFAFGLVLTRESNAASGCISLSGSLNQDGAGQCPSLLEFAEALADRRSITWSASSGKICLIPS